MLFLAGRTFPAAQSLSGGSGIYRVVMSAAANAFVSCHISRPIIHRISRYISKEIRVVAQTDVT